MTHFNNIKLKYVADIYTGNSIPDNEKVYCVNGAFPYISTKDIDAINHVANYENGLSVNFNDGFKIAKENSTLLCIEGGSAGIKVCYLDKDVAFVNKLCCFSPKELVDSRFLFYSLQSASFLNLFYLNLTGLIGGVSVSTIKNLPICLPNLVEQKNISTYLLHNLTNIDLLIDNQEKQIEKLREFRQSFINKAVTIGLNKHVPLKDSGNKFIGMIPSYWSCKQLKYITSEIRKGAGITKEDLDSNGDIYCVRYGEIYTKYQTLFTKCFSKTDSKKLSSLQYFSYGDILCAGTGELVEEIGKSVVYMGEEKCLAGGDIIIIKHKQSPLFMAYALDSLYAQQQKSLGKAKLKVVHISASNIGNIFIALPSIQEQKEIESVILEKDKKITGLINSKKKKVELLKDYKKSLIYECMTGKKEVI